jgi:DNA-binding transcriptional MerR regulator
VSEIKKRIRELRTDGIESRAQDQEEAALEDRLKLMETQREKISAWLAENETAITAFDHVMAGIADMNTTDAATMKLEHAMKELETLATRAQSYSKQ